MGSIHAYSCRQCRGELVSSHWPRGRGGQPAPGAPVLCCGRPMMSLDGGLVLSAPLPHRRTARCPSCGYAVHLVVQPEGPLVCTACQTPLELEAERPGRATPAPRAVQSREGTVTRAEEESR